MNRPPYRRSDEIAAYTYHCLYTHPTLPTILRV